MCRGASCRADSRQRRSARRRRACPGRPGCGCTRPGRCRNLGPKYEHVLAGLRLGAVGHCHRTLLQATAVALERAQGSRPLRGARRPQDHESAGRDHPYRRRQRRRLGQAGPVRHRLVRHLGQHLRALPAPRRRGREGQFLTSPACAARIYGPTAAWTREPGSGPVAEVCRGRASEPAAPTGDPEDR